MLPIFVGPIVGLIVLYCYLYNDNIFMVVWISYVMVPILDLVIPPDTENVAPERVKGLEKDQRFLIPLYMMWLTDFTLYFMLLHGICKGTIGVTWSSLAYHAVCGAHLGAINAAIGHELVHRR